MDAKSRFIRNTIYKLFSLQPEENIADQVWLTIGGALGEKWIEEK